MKSHISITIDSDVLALLKKIAVRNHSSLSRIIEIAAASYANDHLTVSDAIPTSPAKFNGSFSRAETYER